jgi:predicted MPP superfamily phosphohydrolase
MNQHRFLESGGRKNRHNRNRELGRTGITQVWKIGRRLIAARKRPGVKLLLSHDPSHWDAQVRPLYHDIDLMFAGHTHGFQFGIELGNFKWSPSQYAYKQWAGLYQEGSQYLYVNRGFGYIGYPGRIGMPPELTIIELKRA